MILDALLRLSTAQALTSTGTTPSTNVVDLGDARDLGVADPRIGIYVTVGTAFTSGGAGTLQIKVQGSADNSTWDDYALSPVYALADLVAGAKLMNWKLMERPADIPLPRYLRLAYVVGTAAMTAGTVNANMPLDGQANHQYRAGINSGV